MTDQNTRLTAIQELLGDGEARKDRTKWEMILGDESLTPAVQSVVFQKQFYDLLTTEMEEGYQRNDKLRREKRKRTGKSGGYIPPQMRVNSTIGRFLFAYFKWHTPAAISPDAKIETKGLEDIAEGFGFKIDLTENQRQFLKAEERQTVIDKEKNSDYNRWLWGMMFAGFSGTVVVIYRYMTRNGGF